VGTMGGLRAVRCLSLRLWGVAPGYFMNPLRGFSGTDYPRVQPKMWDELSPGERVDREGAFTSRQPTGAGER
jgi:hypothetical protein